MVFNNLKTKLKSHNKFADSYRGPSRYLFDSSEFIQCASPLDQ